MRLLGGVLCLIFCTVIWAEEVETIQLPVDIQVVSAKQQQLAQGADPTLNKLYGEILEDAKLFQEHQANADNYQAALDQFVELSNGLKLKLTEFENLPPFTLPETLNDIELMLAQKDARQVQQNARINILDQQQQRINLRIDQIPIDVQQAQARLSEISAEQPPSGAGEALSEAHRWHKQVRISRQNMLLQMLELEQLSSNNRLELARQERLLAKAVYDQRKTEMEQLRLALAERRRQATEELLESTKQTSDAQTFDLPLLQRQQQDNVDLANQLSALTIEIEATLKRKASADAHTAQMVQEKTLLEEQLSLTTGGATLGERLLAQFIKMNEFTPDRTISAALDQARTDRFINRESAQQLSDLERYKQALVQEANTLLTPLQREQLTNLLRDRKKLLDNLYQLQDQYVFELAKYQAAERQRQSTAEALQELVSRNLLWVANAPPVSKETLLNLPASLKYFTDPLLWEELIFTAPKRPLLLSLSVLTVLITLMLHQSRQRWFFDRLHWLSQPVGRVSYDNISYTLRALLLTILLSANYVAPLLVLGQLFASDQWDAPYSDAISHVLLDSARIIFSVLLLHYLAKPNGVLKAHFLWQDQPIDGVVAAIRRWAVMSVPLIAMVTFVDSATNIPAQAGTGRGAFLILCLLLILLIWRCLSMLLKATPNSGAQRSWLKIARWLLPLLPLLCTVAALAGYYYSAKVLLEKAVDTLFIAGAFWLVFLITHRIMHIQERRLALERARTKRAELIAQRQKEQEEQQDNMPSGIEGNIELEIEEVDIDTLKAQALGLLRLALWVGFLSATFALWRDVLLSFGWLEDIILWQTLDPGAENQLKNITLMSLAMALVAVTLTFFIARNLPSLLELSLLQRMQLEKGVGFAITTVSRYLVVIIGVLVSFNLIGFDWSKLQWLVAAIGVGLGFGLQEIFANMVSGLIILFERPIRPGDIVTINNLSGTISKINIRATTIIDWDLKEIVIPNKTFITQDFINWSLSENTTRVVIKIGVAYGSDLELVEKLLFEAAHECPNVLNDPEPSVFLLNFGDSSCNFEVRVFTRETGHRLGVIHRMHQLVNQKFNQQGISIPFPQMDVHMHRPKTPKAS